MRGGGPVVHVEHEDGDDDGQGYKNHGEQEVLADQGNHQRGGRDGLSDHQEKHSQGEEDRDAEGHLLATVGGQVEDKHSQEGDEQAGDDEVDGVEEGQAPDVQRVRDVRVDLLAAVVLDVMFVAGGFDDGPLATLPVVLEVHGGADQDQVDFCLVVGPGTKLHGAVLVIEWEVGHIDFARALKDGRGDPSHFPRVLEQSFGLVVHLEIPDSTAETKRRCAVHRSSPRGHLVQLLTPPAGERQVTICKTAEYELKVL